MITSVCFFHKNSTDWNLHPRIESGRSHGVSPPRGTSLCSRWCGHVLTELKKEQEKEPLQPTQQELMVKASQEAEFSKTTDVGHFFKTRPLYNTDGKWVCTALQRIYQTEMYRRIEVVWSSSWESRIGPVLDALVSDDQGLMCIEIQVPTASLAVTSAWVRVSQGVTELARQTREFSPEIEGLDVSLPERRHISRSSSSR